ncbi:hypothetical protein B0H14DRAFT_3158801 [Mycena olivaceomarginata]|nr:hypothetical protein B0H14DRAFT_3158801 [Mycena olivaceomarginata]
MRSANPTSQMSNAHRKDPEVGSGVWGSDPKSGVRVRTSGEVGRVSGEAEHPRGRMSERRNICEKDVWTEWRCWRDLEPGVRVKMSREVRGPEPELELRAKPRTELRTEEGIRRGGISKREDIWKTQHLGAGHPNRLQIRGWGITCTHALGCMLRSEEVKPPAKYQAVLKLFNMKLVVDAWPTLEHASGFQIAGKALSAKGCPEAVSWWVQCGRSTVQIPVGLDGKDKLEDFYEGVVLWCLSINPAWRKEGIAKVEDFERHGLNQHSGGNLAGLPSGLNGLTSVLACLGWWYRVAEVTGGMLRWRKLMEDVVWVLTEKH